MRSLREKLAGLRGNGAAPPTPYAPEPGAPLAALEARLLGEVADGLGLKERLERLVAAAARPRERQPRGVPLEELVHGCRVENERGEFYLVDEDLAMDVFHGTVPLSRFHALATGSVAVLCGEPELQDFDLARAVFLDTETTGLAGGAGTAAFLIGVAWAEGDRFHVRQYLMRDYHEEAALLHALGEFLATFRYLVTYNGKAFDIPLLESRYRLNRGRFPLEGAPHLDLLHPARRLWKKRLDSCRLQSLEVALLGLRREGDVPGEAIPQIYFDYLRSRDGRALARVLEHNRQDVLSLAALSALACQWVDEGWAEEPEDVYSLARVFERAQLHERSDEQYRRAVQPGTPAHVRVPSLLALAARARRKGDHHEAVSLWSAAADLGDWTALRALAIHHEHKSRDLQAALGVVDRALLGLETARAPRDAARDLQRRRERLVTKMARRPESHASETSPA
jgi:uncharacterized protein YprB with RNaseH-like and TPR domain